jgi:hypothetical protein
VKPVLKIELFTALALKKNDISHSLDGCNTILPDAKIRAVVLGSLILMITAAKRCPTQKACVSYEEHATTEDMNRKWSTIQKKEKQ